MKNLIKYIENKIPISPKLEEAIQSSLTNALEPFIICADTEARNY